MPFDRIMGVRRGGAEGGYGEHTWEDEIWGYIWCTDVTAGSIDHSCRHGPPPHWTKVVVLKQDNDPALYGLFDAEADDLYPGYSAGPLRERLIAAERARHGLSLSGYSGIYAGWSNLSTILEDQHVSVKQLAHVTRLPEYRLRNAAGSYTSVSDMYWLLQHATVICSALTATPDQLFTWEHREPDD